MNHPFLFHNKVANRSALAYSYVIKNKNSSLCELGLPVVENDDKTGEVIDFSYFKTERSATFGGSLLSELYGN